MRGHAMLLISALVLALLVSSGCGIILGGEEGTGGGANDGAAGGGAGDGGSGIGDTGGSGGSPTKQTSTAPISQVCQPPDMENCYDYEDMQEYLDQIIPGIEQFFDSTYADIPHPEAYIYIPEGQKASSGCTGDSTDESYEYCPADQTIYIGQRMLWMLYSDDGDAAPAVGLAHEWGHHVQYVASVPPAATPVGQISRENQADCIAGAWITYADDQGWLNYPDDINDIDALLEDIAEDEPGRSHGDLGERSDSLKLGIEAGLQGCNDFFPDSPVITSASALPASPSPTPSPSPSASPAASPSASPAATDEEGAVIDAAENYYAYVQSGDYVTTYNLLSSEFQDYYTQDEWVTANTVLDSAAAEFVVTDAYPEDLGLGVPTYAVAVTVYADGSPFDRTTYFVNEGGYWAHYLSSEEVSSFDDALYQ